jgi:hypothetical protein
MQTVEAVAWSPQSVQLELMLVTELFLFSVPFKR